MNIFDGLATPSQGALDIAVSEGFTIRTPVGSSDTQGAMRGFAIRPEKIRVSREAPANAGINSVKGEMWDIAYLGDMTVYIVKLPNGQTVKASSLNAQRTVENPLGYDENVWISFDGDAGVLLKD